MCIRDRYRAARRLVHECCNYDSGNCLLLEDGEPCVCVQSISSVSYTHLYKDKQRQQLFRALAQKNGLILLTDSDAAGFRIRNYITNMVGCLIYTSC